MKKIGFFILGVIFITIIVPAAIVSFDISIPENSKDIAETMSNTDINSEEILNTVKVFFHEEDIVKEMNIDEYLLGVLAAEMPASFEIEALKAQVVAARTYMYHKINLAKNNKTLISEHKGADICTSYLHCKAYTTKEKLFEGYTANNIPEEQQNKYFEKLLLSVSETSNIIVMYNESPIEAVFHSFSSGRTENADDVWNNSVPYLKSVETFGGETYSKSTSTIRLTLEEYKTKLNTLSKDINYSEGLSIEDVKLTEGGSVKTMTIGGVVFKGTELRQVFGLNSANFNISLEDDTVVFNVKGSGHGVGLSQYGANDLALKGKNFEEILKHYYIGCDIIKFGGENEV